MKIVQFKPHVCSLVLLLPVVSFLSTPVKALIFTTQCENAITGADRQLFEDAADLIDRYSRDVEDHINDARAGGNPDRYSFIDAATMSDWRDLVDDMVNDDIKIACEYNNMVFNRCENNTGLLGSEIDIQPGRIHVCIDNVRANADNPFAATSTITPIPGSPLAVLAGTISHELMHIVDGFLVGHNGGTGVTNPSTDAETIGVAMEHLILTPDLRAMINSVEIDCCDQNDEAVLTFDVRVSNMNAEADTGVRALSDQFRARNADSLSSGFTRNSQLSLLQVEVDGEIQQQVVNALNGSASMTLPFEFRISPHEIAGDGIHEIIANADFSNVFFEASELNNIDEATVSTTVDLSLDIEVAAPPECHSQEFRDDVSTPGYYSWIDIPYLVEVINLDSENTSPRVDIVMTYDDMWTDTSLFSQETVWSDSLSPQGRDEATFHLAIPTDSSCSGPVGDTYVVFEADGNAETVNDVDLSNNSVEIMVNEDYWRPDYVIREVSPIGSGLDTRTISYTVRNIGPTIRITSGPSMLASTQVADESNTTAYFSAFTRNLDPGEQQTYEATLPVDNCDMVTYLIEADRHDVVDEYDELNNATAIRLAPTVLGGSCTIFENPEKDTEPGMVWIEENGMDVLYDKFEPLNTEEWGADRATGIDMDSNLPILDQIQPEP